MMVILDTERLFLREYKEEDLQALHSIFSDAETMKYYPAPFSLEKTQLWIKKNQERYAKDGFGLWAVCLKETGEVIGDCGLVKQTVDGVVEVEIGYHIDKKYWSKGYGTEAARGCMDYGFNQLGFEKLISIIDPENIPSIRVAEKNGFIKEKEAFIFDKIHAIYSSRREISKMLTILEKEMEEALKNFEQKDRFQEALQEYQSIEQKILHQLDSLKIDEKKQAYQLLAQCYLRQGNMHRSLGQPEEADRCSKKEIEAAQKSGSNISIAQSVFSEAVTLLSNKQLDKGLQLLEKSRELFESAQTFDHIQGVGWHWIIKADLANKGITQSSPSEVIEFANHALQILLPIENWMGVSRAYEARSIAYQILADQDREKAKAYAPNAKV